MKRKSPNENLVIITAYVEKPATRKRLQQITDRTKKCHKPNPLAKKLHLPTNTGIHNYSRRAQLLAYAREMRSSGTEQASCPFNTSRPKFKEGKKCKSSPERNKLMSFFKLFQRKEKHAWGYERIPTLEIGETEQFCGIKCGNKKRRNSQSKISSFCGRLKRMLGELSCGLQCNKG